MTGHRRLESRAGRGAVLAATLLVLALSLCALDSDGNGIDDHGRPTDLCSVVLLIPAAPGLLARPVSAGRMPGDPLLSVHPVVLPRPDPPPRALALA